MSDFFITDDFSDFDIILIVDDSRRREDIEMKWKKEWDEKMGQKPESEDDKKRHPETTRRHPELVSGSPEFW